MQSNIQKAKVLIKPSSEIQACWGLSKSIQGNTKKYVTGRRRKGKRVQHRGKLQHFVTKQPLQALTAIDWYKQVQDYRRMKVSPNFFPIKWLWQKHPWQCKQANCHILQAAAQKICFKPSFDPVREFLCVMPHTICFQDRQSQNLTKIQTKCTNRLECGTITWLPRKGRFPHRLALPVLSWIMGS